jgi:hypothetical protein
VDVEKAEAEKAAEMLRRPRFVPPEDIIDDFTGHKYVTTHRCFGGPCPDDPLPTSLAQMDKKNFTSGTFNIGDV